MFLLWWLFAIIMFVTVDSTFFEYYNSGEISDTKIKICTLKKNVHCGKSVSC